MEYRDTTPIFVAVRIYHGSQAVAQDAYEVLINSLNKLTMPSIIDVHFSDDASSAMKRFAEHLKSRLKGEN